VSAAVKTPLAQTRSPGGTGYANARIRVARQRLLSKEAIRAFLHEPSFASFFKRLSDSPYGPALTNALVTHAGVEAVSVALADDLRATYAWVYQLSEKRYRKLLETLAAKWDISDLKTIIRAKASGTPLHADDPFRGIGVQIAPEAISALAGQETISDVVALVLTWGLPYQRAFSEGLEDYLLKEDVADFELRLDKAYAIWATRRLRGPGQAAAEARRVFGRWIDMLNIGTLIRLADTPDEVEEPLSYHLPGGLYLNARLFKYFVEASDLTELLAGLKGAIPNYAEPLTSGDEGYQLTGHLSEFQRALEAWATRCTISEGYRDILGFGVMQSYLTAKENETTNLGIIAHGVYRGVTPSIIEKDLILV